MILIDTSIWIDYFHKHDANVQRLLMAEAVVMHDMVIGEIALGSLKDRRSNLEFLRELPQVISASHAEVMAMVEWQKLSSSGIGYVDAHLLGTVYAADPEMELLLWTRDKKLAEQARRLGIEAEL